MIESESHPSRVEGIDLRITPLVQRDAERHTVKAKDIAQALGCAGVLLIAGIASIIVLIFVPRNQSSQWLTLPLILMTVVSFLGVAGILALLAFFKATKESRSIPDRRELEAPIIRIKRDPKAPVDRFFSDKPESEIDDEGDTTDVWLLEIPGPNHIKVAPEVLSHISGVRVEGELPASRIVVEWISKGPVTRVRMIGDAPVPETSDARGWPRASTPLDSSFSLDRLWDELRVPS